MKDIETQSCVASRLVHGFCTQPNPQDALPNQSQKNVAPPVPLADCLAQSDRFSRVRVAQSEAELISIGKIRHFHYINIQKKTYNSISPINDCLLEDDDYSQVNIYSVHNGDITSALRVSDFASLSASRRIIYESVSSKIVIPVSRTIICTRLVRAPGHSGRHVVDLIRFVRWQAVNAGWRYCLMQTSDSLVSFFMRFGFRETGHVLEDPIAGRLKILSLDTDSIAIQRI